MKTLKTFLISLILFSINLQAQVPPPPPPPAPGTTSEGSYIKTVVDDECDTCNSSVSVSNSDKKYSFNARFHESRMDQVKTLLIAEMGENNMQIVKGKLHWTLSGDKDQVYDILLSKDKLKIEMDKELASTSLIEKFESMGESLGFVISGDDKHGADDMQRKANEMQREAERMAQEAKRMAIEAERLRTIASSDAERLHHEAKIMIEHAEAMELEAMLNGGLSDDIRSLLSKPSTILSPDVEQNGTWHWPKLQEELITKLLKDKLIDNENDINFMNNQDGVYVNKTVVGTSLISSYRLIIKKYYPQEIEELHFNKKDENILVISSNSNIIEFFVDLKASGLMNGNKAALNINGYNIILDDLVLGDKDYNTVMKLLDRHNIIPAPGKIICQQGKGSYKLGYSISARAHYGTWIGIN